MYVLHSCLLISEAGTQLLTVIVCLYVVIFPDQGIRFSDVTDTSATVHWTVPSEVRAGVDSYLIRYVPTKGESTLCLFNSESVHIS